MRTLMLAAVLVAGTTARADDLAKARTFFQSGVEAYDAGDYEAALRDFQQSHAMSHNAALYFNMAACEEHLNHSQAAALLLRQYLLEKPDAEDRAQVLTRIQALEQRDAAMKAPEPPREIARPAPAPPPAPTPSPQEPPPRRVISWALLGVTGAIAVAAIGTGAWALVDHGDLESGCGKSAAGCSQGAIDGMRSAQYATDALIGLGAAAAVATVVLFVVEPRLHRSHTRERASIALTPAGLAF